ncbi:MAG TPA: hypothetical protein VIC28_00340 [Thermoanaerobaculia bacterium]|jgi:hypothetical protein
MPAPPNLPAALFRHAASHPGEPWLFQAEGWDWRWHTWGEVAREVMARAEGLEGIAAGSRYAFAYTARPEDIILDLAVQAAGGGAVVLRNGQPVELSAADLIAMAKRIQERIGPTGRRDIVVLSGSFEISEERAMLSWATLTGAAVVLEPNPALRVATAAWVRPTVFHGTVAELAALRKLVEKEREGWFRRRSRLPFRRLRSVLVTGSEGLPPEEEAFWMERGVGKADRFDR